MCSLNSLAVVMKYIDKEKVTYNISFKCLWRFTKMKFQASSFVWPRSSFTENNLMKQTNSKMFWCFYSQRWQMTLIETLPTLIKLRWIINSVELLENQKLLNLCQCWNNSYFFITITGLHYFKLLST